MQDQYLLACDIYNRSEVNNRLHNQTYKGMITQVPHTDWSIVYRNIVEGVPLPTK